LPVSIDPNNDQYFQGTFCLRLKHFFTVSYFHDEAFVLKKATKCIDSHRSIFLFYALTKEVIILVFLIIIIRFLPIAISYPDCTHN